ncbi:hypothetical protein SDRG_17010 [Saprolegnia diclina VS20]|uniref:Uncharacterized protein n=1 Tax=Saprolegnia diclina (strain VS20) TaxID=1156394 RepID=T0PVR7_SAPDV|nr:hypothetical protein SDRG_17010 [Saprolegnia diclina VS20]EQC25115.1 hypothetical protein SDRG_17010 [Saprolegnia diclina VS20]|eukprot:XP_008621465.1 hypothetical protein SDRG_17010 [Saprolegnia diclina VS20]
MTLHMALGLYIRKLGLQPTSTRGVYCVHLSSALPATLQSALATLEASASLSDVRVCTIVDPALYAGLYAAPALPWLHTIYASIPPTIASSWLGRERVPTAVC